MMLNRPFYKSHPIASTASLAKALGWEELHLLAMCENPSQYYRIAKTIDKPDGTQRIVYQVRHPLRPLQDEILRVILRNVHFPRYLTGGVRDPLYPRDYINSARLHCGCHVLVGEDISGFFPAVTERHVRKIFQHLFNFSPVVVDCLTRLCMYEGALPQGAPTSPYLAVLVFFDVEPEVAAEFERRGLNYGRYIDDANVSAVARLAQEDKKFIIEALQRMLRRAGFQPKRRKQFMGSANTQLKVHGLNVNSGRPTIPQAQRRNIRARTFQIERMNRSDPDFQVKLRSLIGHAYRIRKLHPLEGSRLVQRLNQITLSP